MHGSGQASEVLRKRVPCRTKTINSHGFWQENKSGYCSACVWKSGRYGKHYGYSGRGKNGCTYAVYFHTGKG